MSSAGAPPPISESTTNSEIPVPFIAEPSNTTIDSSQTSTHTSDGEEFATATKTLTSRPRLVSRKSSGTMIVPHDHPNIEMKEVSFPPNDARAMSPKRSSAETGRMIIGSRLAIQKYVHLPIQPFLSKITIHKTSRLTSILTSQAEELQSGLNALVEKVENIKSDHDKLEKNNNALQDYIGGLTRSMSRTAMDTGRKK